jgi:hypothetical protein
MPISQNVQFKATVPAHSEFDHPPGAGLMQQLAAELAALGWRTDEFDNWRDCATAVIRQRRFRACRAPFIPL